MDDTIHIFQHAADLVKAWGNAQLPTGKTLAEVLTIQGLSLWDLVAPYLAIDPLPKIMSQSGRLPSFPQQLAVYRHWTKRIAFDLMSPLCRNSRGCARWTPEPVFLFLGFTPYIYRDTLQPVVARFAGRRDVRAIVLHDRLRDRTGRSPTHADVFQSIWQHWDRDVKSQARALRELLRTSVVEIQTADGLPQIVKDEDRSLWPPMKGTFDRLFRAFLPRMLTQAAVAWHILERHRPALIVSPDVADPRTRMYCLLGRQFDIPSLEIQFGLYGSETVEWRFFVADILAVSGEAARDVMLAHGVPDERIRLTGSPRYDCMVSWPAEEVAQTRARLGVPDGKSMVVFASAYYFYGAFESPEARTAMINALFQAADKVDGLCLVVKPHPVEDERELRRLAGARRDILFADKQDDIRELIKASDAFVTFFSTSALGALVMKKLTIILAFPGRYGNNPFVDSGATLVARSTEDIVRSLQGLVDGSCQAVLADLEPARQRFLRQWTFRVDGLAASRIEALALQMASLDSPGPKAERDWCREDCIFS